MTSRTVGRPWLAVVLLFIACGSGGSSNPPAMAGDAQTVSQAASAQIASGTNDSGQAIEVNQLSLSSADTDEISAPATVN